MAAGGPAANVMCTHPKTEINSMLRVCMSGDQCVLGAGSYAVVYRGQYCIENNWREVAVKRKTSPSNETKKEIKIWRDIKPHENILVYLGTEEDRTRPNDM